MSFGEAKTIFTAGTAAGHDMSTKAGVEAWMAKLAAKPLPPELWRGGDAPPSRTPAKSDRERKKQRKAERKARRKNSRSRICARCSPIAAP